MKNSLVAVLSLAAGGTIGFMTANKLLKEKYEQLAQEEIESVKAVFLKNKADSFKEADDKPTEEERTRYAEISAELGYTQEKKPAQLQLPRIITPDEFGEMDAYDEISLTYYTDGTVADDNDRAMSDDEIEETIGKDSLTHFGEYEADSVFVRNDRLKADYEILTDQRTYADVLREKPWLIQK